MHVRVLTPEPSMQPLTETRMVAEAQSNLAIPSPSANIPVEKILRSPRRSADVTPWYEFIKLLNVVVCQNKTFPLTPSTPTIAADRPNQPYTLRCLVDDIISAQFSNLDWSIPPIYVNPYPYLPKRECCTSINMRAISHYEDIQTQVEVLKLCVFAFSNGFNAKQIESAIMDLTRHSFNLSLLEELLGKKSRTIEAFAERLFAVALQHDNIPLLRVIVNSGAVTDLKRYADTPWYHKELRHALKYGQESEFRNLLSSGESSSCTSLYNYNMCKAIRRGKSDSVRALLHAQPRRDFLAPHCLQLAAFQGRLDIVMLFLDHVPKLREEMRSKPWILLEAAAWYGDIDIFQSLVGLGLDPHRTDSSGMGSPLAVACINNSEQLIHFLLSIGVNIHGVCAGNSRATKPEYCNDIPFIDLEDIKSLTALHLAVLIGNVELIDLLLSLGADPSFSCMINEEQFRNLGFSHTNNFTEVKNSFSGFINRELETGPYAASAHDFASWLKFDINPSNPLRYIHYHYIIDSSDFSRRRFEVAIRKSLSSSLTESNTGISCETNTDVQENSTLEDMHRSDFPEPWECLHLGRLNEWLPQPFSLGKEAMHAADYDSVRAILRDGFPMEDDEYRSRFLSFALKTALDIGSEDAVNAILDMGVNPNEPLAWSEKGQLAVNALQYARHLNNIKLVKLLLNKGATVDVPSIRDSSAIALQFAAGHGDFEVLEILLESGAQMSSASASQHDSSVVEDAAKRGRLDMVRHLLQRADMGKNKDLYTRSIKAAWRNGHRALANMIQDCRRERCGWEVTETIDEMIGSTVKTGLTDTTIRFKSFDVNWTQRQISHDLAYVGNYNWFHHVVHEDFPHFHSIVLMDMEEAIRIKSSLKNEDFTYDEDCTEDIVCMEYGLLMQNWGQLSFQNESDWKTNTI